jgi:hypothetical protein
VFQGRARHGTLQQPELREGGERIIMIIERPDRRHRVVAAQRAVRRLTDQVDDGVDGVVDALEGRA